VVGSGGAVNYYTFGISPHGLSQWQSVGTAASTVFSFLYGGLTAGTSYDVRIAACNGAVVPCSAYVTLTNISTAAAQTFAPNTPAWTSGTTGTNGNCPASTVTSSTVTCTWLAPPTDATHSIADSYNFQWCADGNCGFQNTIKNIPASTLTETVANLVASSLYTFAIQACNNNGCSPYSTYIDATTSPGNTIPLPTAQTQTCAGDGAQFPTYGVTVYCGVAYGNWVSQSPAPPSGLQVNNGSNNTYNHLLMNIYVPNPANFPGTLQPIAVQNHGGGCADAYPGAGRGPPSYLWATAGFVSAEIFHTDWAENGPASGSIAAQCMGTVHDVFAGMRMMSALSTNKGTGQIPADGTLFLAVGDSGGGFISDFLGYFNGGVIPVADLMGCNNAPTGPIPGGGSYQNAAGQTDCAYADTLWQGAYKVAPTAVIMEFGGDSSHIKNTYYNPPTTTYPWAMGVFPIGWSNNGAPGNCYGAGQAGVLNALVAWKSLFPSTTTYWYGWAGGHEETGTIGPKTAGAACGGHDENPLAPDYPPMPQASCANPTNVSGLPLTMGTGGTGTINSLVSNFADSTNPVTGATSAPIVAGHGYNGATGNNRVDGVSVTGPTVVATGGPWEYYDARPAFSIYAHNAPSHLNVYGNTGNPTKEAIWFCAEVMPLVQTLSQFDPHLGGGNFPTGWP
jgi:hypothetical protein